MIVFWCMLFIENSDDQQDATQKEFMDKNTKVGSGFRLDERKYYYKNPQDIINKIITVQFMLSY